MTLTDDDRLLEQLAAALETEAATPDAGEISALRALVEGPRRRSETVVVFTPSWPAAVRRPRRRALLVAAAAVTVALSGGAVAVAMGRPFPGALRGAAHAIGLPVDSPGVANARATMNRLSDALRGHDTAQIARARDELRGQLRGLDRSEHHEVDGQARRLVDRADDRLGHGHGGRAQPGQPGRGRRDEAPGGDDRRGEGGDHGRGDGRGDDRGRDDGDRRESGSGSPAAPRPGPRGSEDRDGTPSGSGSPSESAPRSPSGSGSGSTAPVPGSGSHEPGSGSDSGSGSEPAHGSEGPGQD